MTKPSIGVLLLFAAVSAGCNLGKKVEAQSTAVEPKVATVETQPTMFEWRGAHDGMSLAEFQAKFGKNCGESPNTGTYGCVNTEVDKYQSLTALFHHGQVYSFRLGCDGPENNGDNREYQDRCKSVVAAITAHFGKPISDNVKYGTRAITWRSRVELALYIPPVPGGEPVGSLEVCSPVFSPRGQCHPEK
jgi:hypothetical protein